MKLAWFVMVSMIPLGALNLYRWYESTGAYWNAAQFLMNIVTFGLLLRTLLIHRELRKHKGPQ